MKRSDRMALVEKLIASQEDKAARAMGMAKQNLLNEEKKLADLKSHKKDYEANLLRQGQSGISGQQWQSFQFFINQLSQVIQQQHQQVGVAHHQFENVKKQWQAVHAKRQSIGNLVESVRFQEHLEQEKKEQKMLDDLVQQMQLRSKS